MDMTIDEVLAYLDEFHPDWRSHWLQGKVDEFAMDAIAFSFFKSNPSWIDDVVPAIIIGKMEWLVTVFDPLVSDPLRDLTKNAIFDYIKQQAHEFFLAKEEECIAYG
jgi:hypothetical protein